MALLARSLCRRALIASPVGRLPESLWLHASLDVQKISAVNSSSGHSGFPQLTDALFRLVIVYNLGRAC